jgi:hypothetical protein
LPYAGATSELPTGSRVQRGLPLLRIRGFQFGSLLESLTSGSVRGWDAALAEAVDVLASH